MKKLLLFALVICLAQIACQPESAAPAGNLFNGTWRMLFVKDNSTGAVTTKPSSITADVDITFVSANETTGSFTGQTPSNIIDKGNYVTGSNRTITIPSMSMTKVAENSWGTFFVDNILSSESYGFDSQTMLTIRTKNMRLTFQKL